MNCFSNWFYKSSSSKEFCTFVQFRWIVLHAFHNLRTTIRILHYITSIQHTDDHRQLDLKMQKCRFPEKNLRGELCPNAFLYNQTPLQISKRQLINFTRLKRKLEVRVEMHNSRPVFFTSEFVYYILMVSSWFSCLK